MTDLCWTSGPEPTRLLKQQASEKNWEPDWATHDSLVEQAGVSLAAGDLTAALRDFCRAMQTLMTAMKSPRAKGEVFQPVWDKHPGIHPPGSGNGQGVPAYRCEHCGKVVPPPADRNIPVCCEKPMKRI